MNMCKQILFIQNNNGYKKSIQSLNSIENKRMSSTLFLFQFKPWMVYTSTAGKKKKTILPKPNEWVQLSNKFGKH